MPENAIETHGILERVGQSRDGKWLMLKGQWDDDQDAETQLVPIARLDDLIAADVIYQSGEWDNGDKKWSVRGKQCNLTIVKTFQGRGKPPKKTLKIPEGDAPSRPSSSQPEGRVSRDPQKPGGTVPRGGNPLDTATQLWVDALAIANAVSPDLPNEASNEDVLKIAITQMIHWQRHGGGHA